MESELIKKINKGLQKYGLDGLVISGWENVTYLTGAMLPFAPDYPHRKAMLIYTEKTSVLFSTSDWLQFVKQQDWEGVCCVLDENCSALELGKKVQEVVSDNGWTTAKFGVDCARTPEETWKMLHAVCSDAKFETCDDLMRELRIVKEECEIEKLKIASRYAELGFVATLNHCEGTIDAVSFSRAEAAERVRVHIAEFGGHAVGNLTALQNEDCGRYYGLNHDSLTTNGFIRYDLTSQYEGYWASAGRTAWIGKAPDEAKKAYMDNLSLKAYACDMLKPGVSCSDLFNKVEAKAVEWGIPLLAEAGLGYGLGTSEREYPYLSRYEELSLAKNMVIALDIFTIGPKKEWIHSVDMYRITEDGSEKLSWYRDYDRLYEIVGITARHG